MRILLTGGSGLVGSNILEHHRSRSHTLIAPTSHELNLLDKVFLKKYISEIKPDIIVHAAGKVGGIQANISNPLNFLSTNLDIGKNLILAAHSCGVKNLLNLGSSCMYPKDCDIPLTEDLILNGRLEPTNEGYALAKIVCQKMCEYISYDSFFSYKTIIPCNIYGRYDSFDPAKSHLIPAVIHKIHNAIVKDIPSISIWGDGLARREFMYAADLADCIFSCVDRFSSLPPLLNIGTGRDYTINEYYEIIANVLGYKGEFSNDLSRPVGMNRKMVSTKKLDMWGWKPKTSLLDGIKYTYQYYLDSIF